MTRRLVQTCQGELSSTHSLKGCGRRDATCNSETHRRREFKHTITPNPVFKGPHTEKCTLPTANLVNFTVSITQTVQLNMILEEKETPACKDICVCSREIMRLCVCIFHSLCKYEAKLKRWNNLIQNI